jgi:alkanesulfonate monooxygenase SsuD/methylene tetrahydromethanopterin reductase-like flavin-dependent oxidoreductase (luciferase family)
MPVIFIGAISFRRALRTSGEAIACVPKERGMKIGNFLFPESRDADGDGRVIDETIAEARLSERLGVDTVWLAEHHFDGLCAYVDPVSFGAALAAATTRIRIGFAVAQMSLHHPVRIAEQLSLIDNISKGRLIVGMGRGTAYNIYDYMGYGIDHVEAQARFDEAETIMRGAWTMENFAHDGRFWNLRLPRLRPRPFTQPHPVLIRAASGEASLVELGRQGRPFLMNVQSNDETARRVALWKQAAREGGHAAAIAKNLEQSWIWRNVFVAETDAEAERLGPPAFAAMQQHRAAMRERVLAEQGVAMPGHGGGHAPAARTVAGHALLCGSPATVAERLADIARSGVGGVILQFRLGPMPHEVAASSLSLFMQRVMPAIRAA